MSRTRNKAKIVYFTFEGHDKKGIIATITNFFFQHNCNILDIDQRILDDYLIMNTVVDCSDIKESWKKFGDNLNKVVVGKLRMKLRVEEAGGRQAKKIALLVTREAHCPETIINDIRKKKIFGESTVMIGNHDHLQGLAKKKKIPFHFIPSKNKKKHEAEILKILDRENIDLVVLARYMQIVSPEFVFRYEGRILNIHPSLLPAFPGPRAYHQAFNKGVDFVGVTAHFVTTDLDEGPIICQDAFKVNKASHTVEDYIKKGQNLEAKTLAKAVNLFCSDKICLRRGKVVFGKKEHDLVEKTKKFYS